MYHCSVFALLIRFSTMEQKTEQCVCCTTVPCFRTTVLFLHYYSILYHCSVFYTTEQKMEQCFCTNFPCFRTTVPFLHFCSVFPQRNKKRNCNVYMQMNGNDCDLYAIANGTALALAEIPQKNSISQAN